MAVTVGEICAELKNYFDEDRISDTYTIANGSIDLSALLESGELQNGQYFRICESVFNDGVYQYPTSGLTDEVFDGVIWTMRVPPDLVNLCTEINTWLTTYGDKLSTPFQSESFGGYSYTKGGGKSSDSIDPYSWQAYFNGRLAKYRKIRAV